MNIEQVNKGRVAYTLITINTKNKRSIEKFISEELITSNLYSVNTVITSVSAKIVCMTFVNFKDKNELAKILLVHKSNKY